MLTVRPRFAELAFHLYGRPLHPELFRTLAERSLERDGYRAKVAITDSGHVFTFTCGHVVLTEVSASSRNPLPQRRCLSRRPLSQEHRERIDYREGIIYETHFRSESATAANFLDLQHQLERCGETDGLYHAFDSSGRMAMGAFSYIDLQSRSRSLTVKTFHTFPDDGLIVRGVSTIRLRPADE